MSVSIICSSSRNRLIFCILFCSSFLLISSCSNDDNDVTVGIPDPIEENVIESQYQEYVSRFIDEGTRRGVDLDISKLSVVEGISMENVKVCGYGYSNFNDTGNQRVEISEEPFCWEEVDDAGKEILMFHELGHAILERFHKETNYPNGSPTTMMCSEACGNLFGLYNKYTPELRNYYIDELFDPNVDAPSWALKTDTIVFYENDFSGDNSNWEYRLIGGIDSLSTFSDSHINELGESALSIEQKEGNSDDAFSFWRIRFDQPNISVSSSVVVTAVLDLIEVEADGVDLLIRTDTNIDDTSSDLTGFDTTQGRSSLRGTIENGILKVTIPYFASETELISIFVLLRGGGVGKVYVKDLKIEVLQ